MMLLLALACTPEITSPWDELALAQVRFDLAMGPDALRISFPGDLDGDGVDDLLVVGQDGVEETAWILPGPFLGQMEILRLESAVTGASVGSPGDLDGDGVAELLVQDDDRSAEGEGFTLTGLASGAAAGAVACDVDGDGAAELLLPGWYNETDDPNAGRSNAAWIFDAPLTGALAHTERASTLRAAYAPELPVECLGDVDGDGAMDVQAGGQVWMAPPAGVSEPEQATGLADDGSGVDHAWRAGDVDGDGLADVLATSSAGLVLVTDVPAGALDGRTVLGETSNCDREVSWVVGGGDLDGDGLADALVGTADGPGETPSSCVPGEDQGRIDIFLGAYDDLSPIVADIRLEGGTFWESAHRETSASGQQVSVGNAESGDQTARRDEVVAQSFGFTSDLDEDGRDELWVLTLEDWHIGRITIVDPDTLF